MVRPSQEEIDTFVSITGASEAVGLRILEEHGGNLNEAVDAYFNEGDRNMVPRTSLPDPEDNFMDIDDDNPIPDEPHLPLLYAPRSLNPFTLLDPEFRSNFFQGIGGTEFPSGAPRVTHPREVREIPIDFKDGGNQSGGYGRPIIEDVTDSSHALEPEVHGTVIINNEEEEDLPIAPSSQFSGQNDIEEQMIRAAIEASKREAEGLPNPQFSVPSDQSAADVQSGQPHLEDAELAQVVSLSLETAEREKALREQSEMAGTSEMVAVETLGKRASVRNSSFDEGSSSRLKPQEGASPIEDDDEDEDIEDQPLVRQRFKIVTSESMDSLKEAEDDMADASEPSSPIPFHTASHPQGNKDPFHSEWGGISSEEHDEAVMLEAAMFGGVPEGPAYDGLGYQLQQTVQTDFDGNMGLYLRRAPRPPSPTLEAQRSIREQQDDEYLASLQADREKELKAIEEAEAHRLKEQAAKEAAKEEERQKEVMQRELATKEASLPQEPASDDENSVNLLVKMPDGSRRGRRFLKSDLLQSLFDYIDVGKAVKPGSYRLIRPYPRRAFSDSESRLSLSELGLTSKQEALFLEVI